MNTERVSGRWVSPFVMWLIVAAGVATAFAVCPRNALFERTVYTNLLIIPAVLNWIWFFFGALAVNRSVARSAGRVPQLVTRGVYGRVRHPIYSADLFLGWGIAVFMPQAWIIASTVWMTLVLVGWMKLEEAVLLRRFGEAYAAYRRRTPMLVPRYFR